MPVDIRLEVMKGEDGEGRLGKRLDQAPVDQPAAVAQADVSPEQHGGRGGSQDPGGGQAGGDQGRGSPGDGKAAFADADVARLQRGLPRDQSAVGLGHGSDQGEQRRRLSSRASCSA